MSLPGFTYGPVPIAITPSRAGAVANTLVTVALNSVNWNFAACKPDGSDIRVTDSDGSTLLSFFIQSYDPANLVGVLAINTTRPAYGSTKTIYLFGGNPSATTASNLSASIHSVQTSSNTLVYLPMNESSGTTYLNPCANGASFTLMGTTTTPRTTVPLQFQGSSTSISVGAVTLNGTDNYLQASAGFFAKQPPAFTMRMSFAPTANIDSTPSTPRGLWCLRYMVGTNMVSSFQCYYFQHQWFVTLGANTIASTTSAWVPTSGNTYQIYVLTTTTRFAMYAWDPVSLAFILVIDQVIILPIAGIWLAGGGTPGQFIIGASNNGTGTANGMIYFMPATFSSIAIDDRAISLAEFYDSYVAQTNHAPATTREYFVRDSAPLFGAGSVVGGEGCMSNDPLVPQRINQTFTTIGSPDCVGWHYSDGKAAAGTWKNDSGVINPASPQIIVGGGVGGESGEAVHSSSFTDTDGNNYVNYSQESTTLYSVKNTVQGKWNQGFGNKTALITVAAGSVATINTSAGSYGLGNTSPVVKKNGVYYDWFDAQDPSNANAFRVHAITASSPQGPYTLANAGAPVTSLETHGLGQIGAPTMRLDPATGWVYAMVQSYNLPCECAFYVNKNANPSADTWVEISSAAYQGINQYPLSALDRYAPDFSVLATSNYADQNGDGDFNQFQDANGQLEVIQLNNFVNNSGSNGAGGARGQLFRSVAQGGLAQLTTVDAASAVVVPAGVAGGGGGPVSGNNGVFTNGAGTFKGNNANFST